MQTMYWQAVKNEIAEDTAEPCVGAQVKIATEKDVF